jgi:transposase
MVMKITVTKVTLTRKQKFALELEHDQQRDKLVCDRIKAVLLRDEEWSIRQIAQALRLHDDTISRYIHDYLVKEKLSPTYSGSNEKLADDQSEELIAHIEENTYLKVSDICAHVKRCYGIEYTVAGLTDWLKRHKFSYKKPKEVPAKADEKKQKAFIKMYKRLKLKTPKKEPIIFIDSVHPTMASKVSYGWIRTGKEKILKTTASRTRLNISGAIELGSMKTVVQDYETINGESTTHFLACIKASYPRAKKIHIMLDQSGYHRSEEVSKYAKKNGIKLHFLPAYSPNLNPIERLWKVMNESVRNNRYFESPK